MRERTFTCPDCRRDITVPVKPGRPQILCSDCVYQRRLDKAKTDRAAARVAHEVCQREERYSGYWKQWAAANAEAVAEMGRMRRARVWANPDSIGVPVSEWRKILNRYQGCCAYCGVKPDIIHMDHVVPLAKGGRHAAANVLPACPKCNLTKHAMFLSVWRYRGRRRSLSA